jgi:hypothetical protein
MEAAGRGYALGLMTQSGNKLWYRIPAYRAWAADNGCFAKGESFDLDAYFAWLDKLPSRQTCRFATAPDVVGDAVATWARSAPVLPRLRDLGYPAALVAQDGWDSAAVDWDAFDVLFLGGTNDFKLGEAARRATADALSRGKPVHMGRVNSLKRLKVARDYGCATADGTFVAFGPDKNVPQLLRWLDTLNGPVEEVSD